MPYSDPQLTHNPATSTIAPAAWGDVIRDDLEFLIDPPTCSVYNSAAVSVPTSTGTTLNANSENFDSDGLHSTVTNSSRITAQTGGRYLGTASVQFAANVTGIRQVQFLLNGSPIVASVARGPGFTGSDSFVKTFIAVVLAPGDFIEVSAFQASGVSLNTTLVEFFAQFLTR